jgi:hypothetical protein
MKKAKSHRANSTLANPTPRDPLQQENDNLRQRIQYLETITGQDSSLFRDTITEETSSKVDWARLCLDLENTEDRIISVSREKIGQELLRLRAENSRLQG